MSEALKIPYVGIPELAENDSRSATGYLTGPEFDAAVDEFASARPEESVRGWERAIDAQLARIIGATKAILNANTAEGDVAIVGHGGVGTLLLCHLSGASISRHRGSAPYKWR